MHKHAKLIGYRPVGRPPKLPAKGDTTLEKQLGTMTVRHVAALYKCHRQAVYLRYNSRDLAALRRKYGKLK